MIKVNLVCQDCKEPMAEEAEEAEEFEGVFMIGFRTAGDGTIRQAIWAHHVNAAHVMGAVARWFWDRVMPQGIIASSEEAEKQQEFRDWLKKQGLDLG